MKKYIFAVFLGLVLICMPSACSAKDGSPGEGTRETEAQTEKAADEYATNPLYQKKYGGATVDILMGPFAWVEMYTPEGLNGEILNDTIYMRNLAVEERLEIVLNIIFVNDERYTQKDEATPKLLKAILAGDPVYDIYMGQQAVMEHCVREKYLIGFDQLPWIDLSRPWWDKKASDTLNFGNRVYFGVNDANFSNLGMTCVTLFNKNLFAKENIPFPYELVRNGDWTYDEFFKIVKSGKKDLNGDGAIDIKDDQFGYSGWQWSVGPNLYAAMGASVLSKDENGMPELSINSAKSFQVFEKIIALFNDEGAFQNNTNNVWLDRDRFAGGYILMTDYRPYYLDYYRDMADDFGIVPHPKYDKGQEGYRQLVEQVGTFTAVPVICKDSELASAVIEALAIESSRTVMPQYYETILQTKYTRDDESADMIELIAKSRAYAVWLNAFGALDTFANMIHRGEANLESHYQKNESKARVEIEKLIELYSELAG